MDRGAWRAAVHGVAKSRTRLKRLSTHTHTLPITQGRLLRLTSQFILTPESILHTQFLNHPRDRHSCFIEEEAETQRNPWPEVGEISGATKQDPHPSALVILQRRDPGTLGSRSPEWPLLQSLSPAPRT